MSGPAFFLAASALYAAALVAWMQQPEALAACAAAFSSCNSLPNVRIASFYTRHGTLQRLQASQVAEQTVPPWQAHAIAAMFRTAEVTAVAWMHLLLLDVFQARQALHVMSTWCCMCAGCL
jgi:hypothetical protein